MNRAVELVPTEEGPVSRRSYELTPLFWGVVNAAKIGLLVALVVLVGVSASSNSNLGTKLNQLTNSLKATGVCKQDDAMPWRGYILGTVWIPMAGEGPVTPTEISTATAEPNSYYQVVYVSRRLSELTSTLGSNLCSFDSEAACNAENDNPYESLLTSMASYYGYLDNIGLCDQESPFSKAMPEFTTKPVCVQARSSTQSGSPQPCYEPTEKCAFWVKQVDALKALYSHPCHWSTTDTLGNKLSRYFSKFNAYQAKGTMSRA